METIRAILTQALIDLDHIKGSPAEFPGVIGVLGRVAEERVGFRGGWVSSVHLDQIAADVPANQRRALMGAVGYTYHPALTDGRVNNPLACDFGKKPRLYVCKGHASLALTRAVDVARAYEAAQL